MVSTKNPNESPVPTPIAIVGMSCLFPKAQSLREYWSNIKGGVDAITEVPETHWEVDDYFDEDPKRADHTYCRRGGFLSPVDFEPGRFGISPNSIEATDTSQLLGLVVAQGALMDAGYGPKSDFNRERTSVILGVTGTLELAISLGARLGHPRWREALKKAGLDDAIADDVIASIGGSYAAWQEDSFPGLLGNVVAGRIANRFDLGGTNCVVDAACASSISAAHLAILELSSGRADMAITGGVDTFNDIFMYMCFSKTPALSPTGDARPFDAAADGTILGEGIGMVVLKRLADAERDGNKIYAVIKAIGSSSDGRGKAIYAPSSPGQVKALKDTYSQAGISPSTVGLVEGHGTGTKVGDAVEVAALKEVFRETRKTGVWCALGSVKSQIGHTKAAAGVAGLIKVALALKHKVLPPTIKITDPAPALASDDSPFYPNVEKRPWLPSPEHPRRAAVSSFGFGGSNFHMLLEEHESKKTEIDWDGRIQILALSSESLDELQDRLRSWSSGMTWQDLRREGAISRRDFSSQHRYRLLLVAEKDKTDLTTVFNNVLETLERLGGRSSWTTPDGAFFSSVRKPGKLGFLFPGQGSQYVGMCLDLACLFPKMQEVLTQANLAFSDYKDLAVQLSDFVFPLPAFNEEARKLTELALRATHVAQPALGAISMGTLCVLAMFGVQPAAAAGHSFGELMALFAGGHIDAEALHRLSILRGDLMAQEASHEGGSMLAVQASVEEIRKLIESEKLDLALANINAPRQVVLSGKSEEIKRASKILRAQKMLRTTLPVSAAFHSPLVARAAEPFRSALDDIEFQSGCIPVYSNTTGGVYPEKSDEARDLLGGQLARSVDFVSLIENMYEDGVRTFVEVGPGGRLTRLVDSILGDLDHEAIAVDASSGRNGGTLDLAYALSHLAALGHRVDLTPWEGGEIEDRSASEDRKPTLTISIGGQNYRSPPPDSPKKVPAEKAPATPATLPEAVSTSPSSAQEEPPTMDPSSPYLEIADPPPQPPPEKQRALPASGGIPASQADEAPGRSIPSGPLPSKPSTFQIPPILQPTTSIPGAEPVASRPELEDALRVTQDNLNALQQLQKQAADLHRQFLEGQERAQRTIHSLVEQQQRLLQRNLGIPTVAPDAPATYSQQAAPDPAPEPAQMPELQSEPAREPPSVAQESTETPPGDSSSSRIQSEGKTESASRNGVEKILLDTVSEKTGYPTEMLKLDMDMEADLGIDSIKRVEILSAMQEQLPEAPTVQPEQLGSLRTLGQIVEFLSAASPSPPKASPADSPEPRNGNKDAIEETPLTEVGRLLVDIVSEKTGYPPEMLNLDMDMESDLGIDSIKRVEIFSSVQERLPEAPVVQPDDLGRLRTLQQVIDFLSGEAASTPSPPPVRSEHVASLQRRILIAEAIEDDQGIDPIRLSPGSEVWITEDGFGLAAGVKNRLDEIGLTARIIDVQKPPAAADASNLAGLIVIAPANAINNKSLWSAESERWIKKVFHLTRIASAGIRGAGRESEALFVTVSRLDGSFGLSNWTTGLDPVQGGLAALAKTAALEWPEVSCKAIDVDLDWSDAEEAGAAVVKEIMRKGPSEVGLSAAGRRGLAVVDHDTTGGAEDLLGTGGNPKPINLSKDDVVVISGGARGVTAEVAVALAGAFAPKLLLLGRTPLPGPEPAWLHGLDGEKEIKQAIAVASQEDPLTPIKLEKQYRQLMADREIRRTLDRIRQAGGRAIYRSVDVRREASVRKTLEEIRRDEGPIRGLIHGAGILADALIEKKTAEQFSSVFDTKVKGLRALLRAMSGDDLEFLTLFSSASGRFGRAGQVDYAVANEVLNKVARQQSQARPDCRVMAINWGPWDGGMVTPGLRELFLSEGIGLIPLEAGARFLVEELNSPPDGAIEIIVGVHPRPTVGDRPIHRNGSKKFATSFERAIDLENCRFLNSHVIGGKPVMPLSMLVEWLAHGALHDNPGFIFHGFNDLRVLKGLRLENGDPYPIRVLASKAEHGETGSTVSVELRGGDSLATLHARAEVILGPNLPPQTPGRIALSPTPPYSRSIDSVYRDVLFHGELLRGIQEIESLSEEGIVAKLASAPAPDSWMTEPPRSSWLSDPLALDAAIQLILLWTYEHHGQVSLPSFAGKYRQFRTAFPKHGVKAVVRTEKNGGNIAMADIDFLDDAGELIARMERCECVMDPSLFDAFRRRSVIPSPLT